MIFIVATGMTSTSKAEGLTVDMELILAVDCSYSVSDAEYLLQMNGLARALRSPAIYAAIQAGHYKRISIALIQWSGTNNQIVSIPWTAIGSPNSITNLSERIRRLPRHVALGPTSITAVIAKSLHMFSNSPYRSYRKVLDISGDGRNNDGVPAHFLRDVAIKKGVTVNGLAIINETPTLHHYFRNAVIGGQGSFVIKANSYEAYEYAIQKKLVREIAPLPIVQNTF
ncbi:DUF1194 domain-containing protein [Kiloniella sp. EL199]|uniref:DUF1194 domain-containing protein n=1 Tax=Kiloniella sp. EL199 TaxID=2107581 RepID=UPI0013C4525D|nr:DUF1194 domain-containing protein [Kiloniella sp. EL199]